LIFKINDKNPFTILVEFQNYTGPRFFCKDDPRYNWIPISSFCCYSENIGGSRTQFPLSLAYASTIHKSQGQTLDKVVINIGESEKSLGLTFVALSRVKNYKDFLIEPFSLDRLKNISKSISLKPRQDEEKKIEIICKKTSEIYKDLFLL